MWTVNVVGANHTSVPVHETPHLLLSIFDTFCVGPGEQLKAVLGLVCTLAVMAPLQSSRLPV